MFPHGVSNLKLSLHIHALMQNSDNDHCVVFNVIKNKMFPYRMAVIAIADVIAVPAEFVVICKSVEGGIHF